MHQYVCVIGCEGIPYYSGGQWDGSRETWQALIARGKNSICATRDVIDYGLR